MVPISPEDIAEITVSHSVRICAPLIKCSYAGQQQDAHREDLKMVSTITRTMSRPFRVPDSSPSHHSLDSGRRRGELERIIQGNRRLLVRIQSAKSEYSRSRLNAEYIQNQKYALNSSFSLRKRCEVILKSNSK